MADNNNTPGKKRMGTFVALAVVATLVIAPFGSYFYLKGGLKYRLESLEQLKEKDVSSKLLLAIEEKSPFNGNARLIHIPGSQESEEMTLLKTIDKQIVDRNRFDIYSLSDNLDPEQEDDINFVGRTDQEFEFQFIMIDTSNKVRSTYQYNEDLGKEMIRHLSVVVPVPTSRSVHLKREDK